MGDKSNIHWTDASWNPVTGCSRVSEGCRHCYAETLSLRYGWTKKPWTAPNAPENVVLHPERLELPLRWKRPRRIFVNSMSDLFHEQVDEKFVAKVFAIMDLARQHTYQVLTKRPERAAQLLADENFQLHVGWFQSQAVREYGLAEPEKVGPWPLRNVWLGTSVERQREADERIPHLLRAPAAVRFLYCEPLLGPIDLSGWLDNISNLPPMPGAEWVHPPVTPTGWYRFADWEPELHWVIVGGESGPGYRAMEVDWARSLRDQCLEAGVAFFFKQGSGARPGMHRELDSEVWEQFPTVAAREVVPA